MNLMFLDSHAVPIHFFPPPVLSILAGRTPDPGSKQMTPRGQSPVVFFKIGTFCGTFLVLSIARVYIYVGLRRRSGNISLDLSLFVLFYKTNLMNKIKFND